MDLIIELDKIEDISKQKFLLETLNYLGIQFEISRKRQTSEEYNQEL